MFASKRKKYCLPSLATYRYQREFDAAFSNFPSSFHVQAKFLQDTKNLILSVSHLKYSLETIVALAECPPVEPSRRRWQLTVCQTLLGTNISNSSR